jgi:hypothetical protein
VVTPRRLIDGGVDARGLGLLPAGFNVQLVQSVFGFDVAGDMCGVGNLLEFIDARYRAAIEVGLLSQKSG